MTSAIEGNFVGTLYDVNSCCSQIRVYAIITTTVADTNVTLRVKNAGGGTCGIQENTSMAIVKRIA